MTPVPLPDHWTEDASWLLQAMDPNARLIRLIRMDEAAYRSASFLDDRMLKPGLEVRLCALDGAMTDARSLTREDARWIFHIGHVGSTLVTRLLGELAGVLAIREPRSLGDLGVVGENERPSLAQDLRRLFSRSFATDQVALVKATSVVSELAPLLVPAGGSALFLYVSPQNYIAGILAGANSLKELAARHESRCGRLRGRGIDTAGFDSSDVRRAAAAWACEMTSLEAAANSMGDRRILWADFDIMLGDVAGWIKRCARHFDFAAPRDQVEMLVNGPLMQRYSKALEYDYSPALRKELLAETTQEYRLEIDEAIAALVDLSGSAPLLASVLDRAALEH